MKEISSCPPSCTPPVTWRTSYATHDLCTANWWHRKVTVEKYSSFVHEWWNYTLWNYLTLQRAIIVIITYFHNYTLYKEIQEWESIWELFSPHKVPGKQEVTEFKRLSMEEVKNVYSCQILMFGQSMSAQMNRIDY